MNKYKKARLVSQGIMRDMMGRENDEWIVFPCQAGQVKIGLALQKSVEAGKSYFEAGIAVYPEGDEKARFASIDSCKVLFLESCVDILQKNVHCEKRQVDRKDVMIFADMTEKETKDFMALCLLMMTDEKTPKNALIWYEACQEFNKQSAKDHIFIYHQQSGHKNRKPA